MPSLTVVLTRPAGRNDELADALLARGLAVVVEPLVEIEPIDTGPIDADGYDWIVVTSATGARLLRERLRGKVPRVAAIGDATAAAWQGPVDLVPVVSTQEGLLGELPRPAGSVLFAGAEGARRKLIDELGADFVPLYRTVGRKPERMPSGDLVFLASPSAARSLAALGPDIPAVSIGPETTREARRHDILVVAEAATPGLDDVVAAIMRASG